MNIKNQKDEVYKTVSKIPAGFVASYKQIAAMSKIKNPRQIGYILHQNINPNKIPCHRVIRSDGKLPSDYAFGGSKAQLRKLKNEGVKFIGRKIDPKCWWKKSL